MVQMATTDQYVNNSFVHEIVLGKSDGAIIF
jgi:hypothetical protein